MMRFIKTILGFVPHAIKGHMTWLNLFDLLYQSLVFSFKSRKIKHLYKNKFVGVANGTVFVGNTIHEVFNHAKKKYPGRMVYFEPVGFRLYS